MNWKIIIFCAYLMSPSGLFLFGVSGAPDSTNHADPIHRWNSRLLEAIRTESRAPGQATRALALAHLAAWNASEFHKSTPPSGNSQGFESTTSLVASVSAIHTTARVLFPGQKASLDALQKELFKIPEFTSLRSEDEMAWNRAIERGVRSATEMIRLRQDDGATTRITFVPVREIGQWQRTPPAFRPPELPHWSRVRPFILEKADQFRPRPPPSPASPEFEMALAEVAELGRNQSPGRTSDQSVIAEFWSCFSYTATPAGHWNAILNQELVRQKASLSDSLRAYAILNLGMADAAIAAWDCKYHYRFWRPIQAMAAKDGLALDKVEWRSLLEAPPHPEYVSGHSTFAGAGAILMAHIFGGDSHAFSTESDSLPGVRREYQSFSECAAEMGRSRIYGGIHYSFSDSAGQELGRQVAGLVLENLNRYQLARSTK